MIPVPFPHEDEAISKNIEMRKEAMKHLKNGGVIVIFPAGTVAKTKTLWGKPVESDWNPFTSKMIFRSGADIVPVFFQGRNSRLYYIADKISAVLGQGLLIHEICRSLNKPQSPIIRQSILSKEVDKWKDRPREFLSYLKKCTLFDHK